MDNIHNNEIIQIAISDIKVGTRFRKQLGDLATIAEDINKQRLLQPIGITPDYELVFGLRRLLACRDILGWSEITAHIVHTKTILDGQISENCIRKQYVISEMVEIVDAMRSFGHGGDRRSNQRSFSDVETLTVGEIAKRVGLGGKHNYSRAKRVIEHGDQALIEAMDRGNVSVAAAAEIAKLPTTRQKAMLAERSEWTANEVLSRQESHTTTFMPTLPNPGDAAIHSNKGLSGSKTSHGLGSINFDTPAEETDEHEFYPTPQYVIQALLDRERFEGKIWEPACGDGAISKVLQETGYNVTSTDITDRGFGKVADFLKTRKHVDNIVTNPPFSLAEEFIWKALSSATKRVAMFLPMSYYSSLRRYELWQSSPLQFVYVFTNRVSLYPGGDKCSSSTGRAQLAWFIWDHGYEGEPVLRQFPPDIPTLAKSM